MAEDFSLSTNSSFNIADVRCNLHKKCNQCFLSFSHVPQELFIQNCLEEDSN
jgi:hypothetical protein